MSKIEEARSAPLGPGVPLPPPLPPEARQEIRIAVALNGGVSLAIWMSGVTLELHHLALAASGVNRWSTYRQILDLLGATVRIDVVAGTSAGGLNGAFLSLALTHGRDLGLLRDVWTTTGSLDGLLRPALEKNAPSLLRGDEYFLPSITRALRRTVSDADNPQLLRLEGDDPLELILTGTLWQGRATSFTDDMGVGITERDHDALFRFRRDGKAKSVGNLNDAETVIEQLAAAARCTSSFPGAFEPHWVTSTGSETAEGTWGSTAGLANFQDSQFVVDGGVLLNKPVRPALDAIYRQPAHRQVRRLLAYIVPAPGEVLKDEARPGAETVPTTPLAGDVLLGVLTRLRSSESVARELALIRDRNASVRSRRRARGSLSQALISAAGMADSLFLAYRDERNRSAAATISRLLALGQLNEGGPRAWSEREIADALSRYASYGGFPFVPAGPDLAAALSAGVDNWDWGQTAVGRLGDMTVDLLKRVVWLAQLDSGTLRSIVAVRAQVAQVLKPIRDDRKSLNEFWALAARGEHESIAAMPAREGAPNHSATNVDDLDMWISKAVPAWDSAHSPNTETPAMGDTVPGTSGTSRRARMHQQALALAAILSAHRAEIQEVIDNPNLLVDPSEVELKEVKALSSWLLGAPDPASVLDRMLRLDVVQVATSGAVTHEEQEVELVQLSCSDPSVITGMQMHHFGAFYRAPWRVNDWIEGRLDGAKQVVRMLLSPERIRQRGYKSDELYRYLHSIAVPAGPHQEFLEARWDDNAQAYREEIDRVLDGTGTSAALDKIADAVSMPLRLETLEDDLPALAGAIRGEGRDAAQGSAQWLASYDAKTTDSRQPDVDTPPGLGLAAKDLWALREDARNIGKQTIKSDIGSDTFARTSSHAATVTAGLLSPPQRLGANKAVRFALSTIRGYTAMLWAFVALLTRRSSFGTHAVELAVAVGAALLAVTLLVPGVPLGLTLVGVLLLLAGATAASLLAAPRGRRLAARLGIATALFIAVVGLMAWRDITTNGWAGSATQQVLAKAGVGLAIVLLGAFVAQARPSKEQAQRLDKPPKS